MAKKKKIYVVGAGGQGRVVINLLKLLKYDVVGIYDDNYIEGEVISGIPLIGTLKAIKKSDTLVLASGDDAKRKQLVDRFGSQILKDNLIHPRAYIEKMVELGEGNQLLAGAYVNVNAKIGSYNLLNTASIVEHEVDMGSYNHISVGAIICGRCVVGSGCFIGAGTVVINNINIGDGVILGANSVVVDNIKSPGTYVGNPARKIK